ncbi:unnamed protein product [marine sediment metagenome]|uniref:Uncharacterized protein n=1 Tax=marine sediment metagenome TaxID=412755 RepID=X1FW79_9ZZZZ
MTVKGEAIYKASERIKKYGVEAFVKMLGKTAIKKRGGKAKLLKYYAEKYPSAPLRIEPAAPYISRSQKSYWRDVKSLAESRDINIKSSRKLLKKLKTDRNVQVRVIKHGEGWQLVMLGLYENTDKESMYHKQQEEAVGHSYVHEQQDYDECLRECIREAQATLGGSGWQLIKILKETWIRYYGREE